MKRWSCLYLCLLFLFPPVLIQAEPEKPMAHYTFDEGDAKDVSGNAHHGIVKGAMPVKGIGRALYFDGKNDQVELGNLDVDSEAMTIAAWMKVDTFKTADARIISKSTGTDNDSHYFMLSTIRLHGYKLRFRLKTDDGFKTKALMAPLGQLHAREWHHVTAVYDGRHMKLYKDGEEVASTSKTGRVAVNPEIPVWIGRNPDGKKPFNGIIDDVRIYKRALSTEEIDEIIEEAYD